MTCVCYGLRQIINRDVLDCFAERIKTPVPAGQAIFPLFRVIKPWLWFIFTSLKKYQTSFRGHGFFSNILTVSYLLVYGDFGKATSWKAGDWKLLDKLPFGWKRLKSKAEQRRDQTKNGFVR